MSELHPFIANWLKDAPPSGGQGASRRQRFASATIPTRKSEEWRFFDLRPIVDTAWKPAGEATADLSAFAIPEAGTRLEVVNGRLTSTGESPDGAFVGAVEGHEALASPWKGEPERSEGGGARSAGSPRSVVQDGLGSAVAPYADDPFAALNAMEHSAAIFVVVPKDTVVEKPIHVVFGAATGEEQAQHPRLFVHAGRGSKFTIIEEYRSTNDARHFTNAVTEVVVGESANVTHVRVQRENAKAAHIGRTGVRIGAHARYDSVAVTLGAKSARNDVWVSHEGEDGWSRIDGLALVDDTRECDTHSVIDNTKPRCESHQLHKCVVGDRGHAVFNGKILVRQAAQRTDAYQLNRNLLLDVGAKVDTKPQLEIFADDVKCTHGATVGQLDEEQLFYLTSRGISAEQARSTLTYAFAAEVIETIPIRSLADDLEREAHRRTMRGAQ